MTVFLRDGEQVLHRTYDTTGRGVDHLLFDSQIADLTPYGRQEAWEDSPSAGRRRKTDKTDCTITLVQSVCET